MEKKKKCEVSGSEQDKENEEFLNVKTGNILFSQDITTKSNSREEQKVKASSQIQSKRKGGKNSFIRNGLKSVKQSP